jgi:hypothetical protein
VYAIGETQADGDASSREQRKEEPGSLEANANVPDVAELEAGGPEPIVVSGGVVSVPSIVQERAAGVGSTLPAASVARTSKV